MSDTYQHETNGDQLQERVESVYIGQNVIYYNQAQTNATPICAIVQDVIRPGLLHLAIMPKYSTTLVTKSNVHHASSNILNENKTIASEYGCWDFPDAGLKRRREKDSLRRKTVQRIRKATDDSNAMLTKNEKDDVSKILRLRDDDNLNATEIAEQMGQGWNHQKVNAMLRKNNRLVAT